MDNRSSKKHLRSALLAHVAQPPHKRNPAHSVVAIYLGREEWMSLVNERGLDGISLRGDYGDIRFDGVPVYRVNEESHMRIVSEYAE